MEANSQELVEKVSPVIKKAGQILLSYFGKPLELTTKQGDGHVGFATQADMASERYLIEMLATIMPNAGFIAEESGLVNADSDYCWVIDPLDGTTNFINNIPYFCISVALTYKNEPIFGMIYQPVLDELFYATANQGAFLNGRQLQLDGAQPAKYVVSIGLRSIYKQLGFVQNRVTPLTFRQFGALALDLAYIAAGRMHAGVYKKMQWWDVAAGSLIIRQSGGKVTDFQGKELHSGSQSCLAAGDPDLYGMLQKMLK